MTHATGSAFESCPAATGPIETAERRCPHFPDGAHRCGRGRDFHAIHECTDGFRWSSFPEDAPERSALRPQGTARFRGETK